MKALVIAPQPFFTPRGTPFSVYYRTMVMAEHGVEVDLLTYGEGEDVVIPGCRIIRIPRFRFLGPVKIGPSFTKLFFDVFIVLWTTGLLLKNRYAFVHAHEEAVFFCRFLKPLFGFKLVYDMHSSLPQQLTNFRFTTSKTLVGLFERLERSSLHAAEAVITICPDLAEYALGEGVDPERHFLIENSIFEDVRLASHVGSGVEPATGGVALPDSDELVVYAGTLEHYQGIDILLRAFPLVREARPDARLLVVGGTPDQVESMRALADELGLGDACVFTGRVPKSVAREYLDKASVLVSPRRSGTNTPLKVYEQLASGKPIVATRIWSHTQVLNDDVCFLVEPDPSSMAAGIVDALQDERRRALTVAAALKLYETEYSRSMYEQKIERLLGVLR
jgi:glycosyltransferase involved in cell wall biosynthesis